MFFEDTDRERYLELLVGYAQRHGVAIGGYCLMTNHVHLILIPEAADGLGLMLRATHMRYAQELNARLGWSGHLWQGRYFSCALDEQHYWLALRYVEQNPVRAGLAALPWEYRWSSAAGHCGRRADPILTGGLPGDLSGEEWQDELAVVVLTEEADRLRQRTLRGCPCGTDDLLARVSALVGREVAVRGRGRPRTRRTE